MKYFIAGVILGVLMSGFLACYSAGKIKYESQSNDAGSTVAYGTSDAGDTVVRLKTTADGTLIIN